MQPTRSTSPGATSSVEASGADQKPSSPWHARLVDAVGASSPSIEDGIWPPPVIPAAQIAAEVERLSSVPRPDNGRRISLIVHPLAEEPGLGLAPGIQVRMGVLPANEHRLPMMPATDELAARLDGVLRRAGLLV